MRKYVNYHKHDHVSSFLTPDTPIKAVEFVKRAIELGDTQYFTTNHGTGGDIFEAKTLCDQYGLRCMYGLEGYIVKNPLEKDKRNYHIIIIPKTDIARKKVNYVNSMAHINGYYYKPRIFIEDLLALDKDDVYITTACVAGFIRDNDGYNDIFLPLYNHFQNNVFIEVQAHNAIVQREHNQRCVEIAQRLGLGLIAATDAHYIYPEQSKDRDIYLAGKGVSYGDEDSFILDYPDGDTLYNRFVEQGVLTESQITEAMDNTFIFESCEDIQLNKDIKMPTIYPNLTSEQKCAELKRHLNKAFKKIVREEHIPKSELPKYKQAIKDEMKVIEDTAVINMPDYFLFNEELVKLAVNKYGGILTRTGRGSCGAFYINKLLGMTQIDRLKAPVPLYSSRFISVERCLENRSMADIDYNIVAQEPFQKAAKELLGEYGCYPMIAYGTMQEGEAFRNICRSHHLEFDEYNDVAKNLDKYRDSEKWQPLIEESKKIIGSIMSASVHPCAHVLDNKDLRYEYGVVRVKEAICVMCTSNEADEYKLLKDDFLIVSVWKLISETFEMIGQPIMTIKELEEHLDEKVWKLFRDGITATLNQVDGDWATGLVKQYKIHSVGEAAMFTAALRPSFESWRDIFINRQTYTTGCEQLDKVLQQTHSLILFQENLMQYFEWLGVSPAESIGLIKKISKKKIHKEDFDALEERLHQNWIKNVGNDDKFEQIWSMVQSCISYGFCSAHGLATGYDMLYGAYLKSHYPLEYYTVCLNNYADNQTKTTNLTNELAYFGIKLKPIKFRYSSNKYMPDKSTNSIYKSIKSLKFMNDNVAQTLYVMRNTKFDSFIDFLKVNPCDSRQTVALIKLSFFSEFGKSQYLLDVYDIYNEYSNKSIIKKDKCTIDRNLLLQFCTETEKQYKIQDREGLIQALCKGVEQKNISIMEYLQTQNEYLGYIDYINPKAKDYGFITEIETKYSPKITMYQLDTGKPITVKMSKVDFNYYGVQVNDTIKYVLEPRKKSTRVGDKWVKTNEEEYWITKCRKVE